MVALIQASSSFYRTKRAACNVMEGFLLGRFP